MNNKPKLSALATQLLEKEVIFRDDLELIFGKRQFERDKREEEQRQNEKEIKEKALRDKELLEKEQKEKENSGIVIPVAEVENKPENNSEIK